MRTLGKLLLGLVAVFGTDAHVGAQSLLVEWSDCRLVVADMGTRQISSTSSEGVDMACATEEGSDVLICRYIAGDTENPRLEGPPSVFGVEERNAGYLFASNETNSTRIHLNLRTRRAILKANYFQSSAPDGFGVKVCVGSLILRQDLDR